MNRIKWVRFNNHEVLGNLYLDFCDSKGEPLDTIIIAGENGTGKSIILNVLYGLLAHTSPHDFITEVDIMLNENGVDRVLKFRSKKENGVIYYYLIENIREMVVTRTIGASYNTTAIFSDIEINYNSKAITSTTSNELDQNNLSRKSTAGLSTEINQLLVDIQTEDDRLLADAVRNNPKKNFDTIKVEQKSKRFTKAFNKVFDNLNYCGVENGNNRKQIIFEKYGKRVPIDGLSSGEKQIVYRGCFLLKDINAIDGAFVFIDEPEISLHPKWQDKILDYYKDIFTNENGEQTSQIFVVTHSPFIIHNPRRKNDKVIVLSRNKTGEIIVQDKPEYYECNSISAIKDAFDINTLEESSTVYLEGETDELYFRDVANTFDLKLPFSFKYIGYKKDGKDINSGSSSLSHAYHFLVAKNSPIINVVLYDNDTGKGNQNEKNVFQLSLPKYHNSKGITIGIESLLILDNLDIESFYDMKYKNTGIGKDNCIVTLKKMELCNHILSLSSKEKRIVYKNLYDFINNTLVPIFTDKKE